MSQYPNYYREPSIIFIYFLSVSLKLSLHFYYFRVVLLIRMYLCLSFIITHYYDNTTLCQQSMFKAHHIMSDLTLLI